MDLYVLDEGFNTLGLLDQFDSFIWTDRYNEAGDFEIYTAVSTDLLNLLKADRYLWWGETEHTMIIEQITIDTDEDTGNMLTVTGRSLESILDRRIIWNQTDLNDTLPNCIKKLLNENAISPTDPNRKIPGLIFVDPTDTRLTSIEIEGQITGDNLYDTIVTFCQTYNIGFKVTLNDENQFVFSMYVGDDRSYSQDTLPYVVFSPDFENVINSNYFENKSTLKNVTLVAGEQLEGQAQKTAEVGSASGLERREIWTDARDISSTNETGGTITDEEYTAKLKQRGEETLAENKITKAFEGDLDANQTFVYKKDFFLGDIVQIVNDYGIEARSRVSEMVYSEDSDGVSYLPTFIVVDEEEESETE